MRQILFRIPPWSENGLPIYGYGMMLFLAFLVCNWLAGRRAKSEGIDKDRITDLAIWLFVGGLVGARITYLLAGPEEDRPTSFLEFVKQFPRIWDGGIILYGAVLGGLAGYGLAHWIILRKYKISTWKIADIIAPAVAVGLALGRIGCLLNGCCYGHVACQGCPALPFPYPAPPRVTLVQAGYQSGTGFTMTQGDEDDLRTVASVVPGSGAANSGLQQGDVIVKADGHDILNRIFVVYKDENSSTRGRQFPVTYFDTLGECRRYVQELRQKNTEVLDIYTDLENYLVRQWPRGKTELTLAVQRGGLEKELPTFSLPWTLALHPTQVYETISMALLFLLLTAYYPFRRNQGEVMALLMVCYGLHRYLNEQLRNDIRPVGFEAYVSLILIVAGLVLGLWLRFKPGLGGMDARPALDL